MEAKSEEIGMLRAVLAQQKGNRLGPTLSTTHLMGGLSSTALTRQRSAWESNSSSTSSLGGSALNSSRQTKEVAKTEQPALVANVSCQTVETVFGQCDVCADTAKSLLGLQNTLICLSKKYCQISKLNSQRAKWLKAGMVSTAGMMRWMSNCETDLETLDGFIEAALTREASLKAELQTKEETLSETLMQIDDLQVQIEQLESSLHEIQDDHKRQLLSIRQEFAGKEQELEVLNKRLEEQLKEIRANEHTLEETLEDRRKSCYDLGDNALLFHGFVSYGCLCCGL